MGLTQEDKEEKRQYREFIITAMLPTYFGTVVALHFLMKKMGSYVVPKYGIFVLGLLVCLMGPGFAIAYGAMKVSYLVSARIGNWMRLIVAPLAAFLFSLIIGYLINAIFL